MLVHPSSRNRAANAPAAAGRKAETAAVPRVNAFSRGTNRFRSGCTWNGYRLAFLGGLGLLKNHVAASGDESLLVAATRFEITNVYAYAFPVKSGRSVPLLEGCE